MNDLFGVNIKEHEGYIGLFTTNEADGAIPNGSRIVKIQNEPGDLHAVGARATMLGSIAIPLELESEAKYMYWVEWDTHPKHAVVVLSNKIAKVENHNE